MTASSSTNPQPPQEHGERRGFFSQAAAAVVGGLVVAGPLFAGLRTFFDPLRRSSSRGQFLRVASLGALPEDGAPRRFPVIAVRRDAWNKYPPEPIGAVYLRRIDRPEQVEAFNVICPHLGCPVAFNDQREIFQCPCHTSSFSLDGAVMSGPSPRGLDTMECEVRGEGHAAEVWVKFENFYTGRTAKDPKA